MFNRQSSANAVARNEAPPSMLLARRTAERIVKDEVVSPPVRDPYEAITRASERFAAGRSIFECAEVEMLKQPA